MKIYVAGKYGTPRVEKLMEDIVNSEDHELTCDWRTFPPDCKPYVDKVRQNRPLADNMVQAVKDADLFILVLENGLYGAMVELGVALAEGKRVWVALEFDENQQKVDHRESIFMCCTNVKYMDLEIMRENLYLPATIKV
jgi:nucleoside 2-deoxyribosyltransferase